jgi:predicted transcriptional regulator
MSSINEIIEETGYQVFWPKSVPFDLCVYKEDEKSDTIKDFTLIGGTECGDMSSNSENCVNQDFLKKIDQDSAIIYDEEFYDEKIAKSRQIPYLQPKDLRKLEDIKEFKKFIRRKKKG